MTNCQLPNERSDESIGSKSDDGEDAPKPPAPAPMAFGNWSGRMPFGDSPNYIPPSDPMKPLGGMQDNPAEEIAQNVENSVARSIVESGEATVVSPTATNDSEPSGDE